MRVYVISCLVAAVIAIAAVFALNAIQKPADGAFAASSSVRI